MDFTNLVLFVISALSDKEISKQLIERGLSNLKMGIDPTANLANNTTEKL